jgi:hypothetical protein
VNHSAKRRFVPTFFRLLTISINRVHNYIATCIVSVSPGFIAVTNHFSRVWIELGMRGEGRGLHLTVKIVATNGLKREWIHGKRGTVFLDCEQDAAPENNVGV